MNEVMYPMSTGPGWFELVSLALNILLSGGLWVTVKTLKATKREAVANARKAEALADSTEISSVDAAVKIWRDLAVDMSSKQEALSNQVEQLSFEVRRLKNATNRVIRLLDRITPENLEEMVKKIKDEIDSEHTDILVDGDPCKLPISPAHYPGTGQDG